MRIETLQLKLRAFGAKTCHEQRVLRAWLQARALDSGARRHHSEDYLPRQLREALPDLSDELEGLVRLRSEHSGKDGSARLLLELADEEIRNGIKEYANWPTIPQLYINGEFVGGADIMREMYQSGELQQMLGTSK